MNQTLHDAADRLARILETENAALVDLDFNRVGSFVNEKRAALDALNALSPPPSGAPTGMKDPAHQAVARRLQHATSENKRLLEQAIAVQTRIMAVLAGAARQAQALPGYGAKGHRARSVSTSAVALIVRA